MKHALPLLLFSLGAAPAFAADIPGGGITPDHLSRHVRVLASDAFEGRAPATSGEEKTIAYVVDELKKAGVQPGGERGTWTQDVPLVRAQVEGAVSASLRIGGETQALKASIARMVERAPEAMYLTHYGPVSDVPRRAQSLYEQIDAMVAIADACDGRADRHRCIAAALSALYLERAHAQQVPLADEDVLRLLAMDIELNAQGLGVWLDRGRP